MGGRAGGGGGLSRGGGARDMSFTDVNTVSNALQQYANQDHWNKNDEYRMGFNADAMGLVENLAKGDYGLASTIAKQATERPNWNKYGANFSPKQSYVMAKAAVDNGLVPKKTIFDASITKKVAADEARKQAARVQKWNEYSATYKKSSTKVAVGSRVYDSKKGWGTIGSIITKSSGYVAVKYDSGTVGKAMAFNLKGEDGNPLKKRPK